MPDIQTAVPTLFAGDSMGSGFVISPDGYRLTKQHVVGDARCVRIKFPTGWPAGQTGRSRARPGVFQNLFPRAGVAPKLVENE